MFGTSIALPFMSNVVPAANTRFENTGSSAAVRTLFGMLVPRANVPLDTVMSPATIAGVSKVRSPVLVLSKLLNTARPAAESPRGPPHTVIARVVWLKAGRRNAVPAPSHRSMSSTVTTLPAPPGKDAPSWRYSALRITGFCFAGSM